MNKSNEEPLLGDEVIRIGLEKFYVILEMGKSVLQIGGDFYIKPDSADPVFFMPSVQQGAMGPLWKLVGAKIVRVEWGEDIRLVFDIGTELKIPSEGGARRGTLLWRDFPSYDDF